jgi:C1A family cysteine protease
MTITGHTDVPSRDENALKAAVSQQPVSVAIEADKSAFQLYKSGILDNSACGTNLDHGVLAVGYGTDGKDYWMVKNSWGASWGEQGYIRMVRGKNQCGISQQPSYPTGAKKASLAASDEPDYVGMWTKFKNDYNKDYSGNGEDEQKRFDIFKKNVDIIEEHNAKKLSYWLGVNEFADQTSEEFFSTHLGYKGEKARFGATVPFPNITDVADSIDWVAKGAVTPVKNQQQCGSCWAFSPTGALEGAFKIAGNALTSLSEEDLVQCNSVTDSGCQGGLMDNAFNWVQQNGICSESAYPYTSGGGVTGTCKKGCSTVMTITGHTDVPSRNEAALKQAVSQQPVSVAIEADKSAFQLYSGGILDNSACGTNLDHGVLVVGYGTEGKDYWKVKNSWGASWGEQGYIRMVRNKNQCGISQQPSYPTGAKKAAAESVVV